MEDEYYEKFRGKEKEALELALDIRKFEIELYWKRTTYFWAFIAATFAGYLAIQPSSSGYTQDFSIILSCFGIGLSFAWYCVNIGSKRWQENWEAHVDMLEKEEVGLLYKTVLSNTKPRFSSLLLGSKSFSVSKINQFISLFTFFIWGGILWYSLPEIKPSADINWLYVTSIAMCFIFCLTIIFFGRSGSGETEYKLSERIIKIAPKEQGEKRHPFITFVLKWFKFLFK